MTFAERVREITERTATIGAEVAESQKRALLLAADIKALVTEISEADPAQGAILKPGLDDLLTAVAALAPQGSLQ